MQDILTYLFERAIYLSRRGDGLLDKEKGRSIWVKDGELDGELNYL